MTGRCAVFVVVSEYHVAAFTEVHCASAWLCRLLALGHDARMAAISLPDWRIAAARLIANHISVHESG